VRGGLGGGVVTVGSGTGVCRGACSSRVSVGDSSAKSGGGTAGLGPGAAGAAGPAGATGATGATGPAGVVSSRIVDGLSSSCGSSTAGGGAGFFLRRNNDGGSSDGPLGSCSSAMIAVSQTARSKAASSRLTQPTRLTMPSRNSLRRPRRAQRPSSS
jgi:hypothetical protein